MDTMPKPRMPDVTSVRASHKLGIVNFRRRMWIAGHAPSSLGLLIPLAIAATYLVVLALRLPRLLQLFSWNSDISSGFTIAETVAAAGTGGHTVLSSTGAYVSLWFGLLTAYLPLHRALWEGAAPAVFVLTALTIGWSTLQITNRRAAVLAVLLVLVATPAGLTVFITAFSHNAAYLGTALLGAYVVWMTRARPRRRVSVISMALLAGLVIGACLASDLLLLATAIVPFACTAALASIQRGRRAKTFAISALVTLATAVAIAFLTSAIMGSAGFVTVRPSTAVAPLPELSLHAEYLYEGIKELFNGYLGGQPGPGTLRTILDTATDLVVVAALLMLLALSAQAVGKLIRSVWQRDDQESSELTRRLHIAYWACSAVSTAGAFELSVQATHAANQYYATLIFSVAAVAPLLMCQTQFAGWLVPIGAAIFFAASLAALNRWEFPAGQFGPGQYARDESAIVHIAEVNHATTGYAGYWYASDLTWNSHERLRVRPVSLCAESTGTTICPFYIARAPAWYVPEPRRTFLLVNPSEAYLPGIPEGLGQPIAAFAFPDSTRMYIYPYDIAARFGPAPN